MCSSNTEARVLNERGDYVANFECLAHQAGYNLNVKVRPIKGPLSHRGHKGTAEEELRLY